VMLPKVSGFEVCRALLTKQPTRDLRVIFLTARGSELDIVRGREAGADLHIGKPFSTKELVEEVEKLLKDASPDWTPWP
ncbi:MAG: response regulator, partial [Betaproteobacteria bacterium]|nr:response regulator [Betaproteobacteria bacterium]